MSVVKFGHLEDGPWTLTDLRNLMKADLSGDRTPGEIAWKAQHSIPACDLARWTLLGRSYDEALSILNGRDTEAPNTASVCAGE